MGRYEDLVRRGRPIGSRRHTTLTATKPWEKEGMSRRTWERRRSKVKGESRLNELMGMLEKK